MKLTQKYPVKSKSGMTLLELTVVILVLLSLISILFIGARAWKRGSDRAASILQIRNVQQAVRSYANMNQVNPGDTVTDLRGQLFGEGRFMQNDPAQTTTPGGVDANGDPLPDTNAGGNHPAGPDYTYVILAENVVPAVGTLYLTVTGADDASYFMPTAGTYDDW